MRVHKCTAMTECDRKFSRLASIQRLETTAVATHACMGSCEERSYWCRCRVASPLPRPAVDAEAVDASHSSMRRFRLRSGRAAAASASGARVNGSVAPPDIMCRARVDESRATWESGSRTGFCVVRS